MYSPVILKEITIKLIKDRDPSLIGDEENGTRNIALQLIKPHAESKFIQIPVDLESPQAWEFIGLTAEKAQYLLHRKFVKEEEVQRNNSCLWDFELDDKEWMIENTVGACDYALFDGDSWTGAMTKAGVKQDIRDALMKQEHENIRETRSLMNWIREIFETNYVTLQDIDERISQAWASPLQERPVPRAPPGHLTLFKSVEYGKAKRRIYGNYSLTGLEVGSPNDFSLYGGLYYTDQLWAAKQHSSLLKDACPIADLRILEVHVPSSHLKAMKVLELKFEDDEFKQLVYQCRSRKSHPEPLSRLLSGHGIIHGPMSRNLDFKEVTWWDQITTKHLLQKTEQVKDDLGNEKTTTEYATQWVWHKFEAEDQFSIECKSSMYIQPSNDGGAAGGVA